MLDTSVGVLANNYTMNDLTTMSSIVFVGATAGMCIDNTQLPQFLGQPSTSSSAEIIDLIDMDNKDETDDVPMALAPIPELLILLDMEQIDDIPMTLALMPELIDLTGMDQIADVPMSLAPRKNITCT